MKLLRNVFYAIVTLTIFAACEDLGGEGQLIIDPVYDSLLEQTVGSETLSAEGVSFTSKGAWTSQVVPSTKASQPMWVSITPDHGDEAGTYTISINLEANDTGEDRKADIIISCGDQTITITITQVATPEVPSQGEDDNSKPQPKYVSSIDYRYTNTIDEYESVHYTLTYRYDDQNRVVRVEEVCDCEETYDSYEIWHTFDYTIVDNVTVTSAYKSGGDDSVEDETYDVTLQNGRVTQALLIGEYESWDTYKYTFSYNDAGYLTRMAYHSTEYGEEGANIVYTDGFLTGVTWDDYGEEDDDSMIYDLDAYYPNRYPNNKTNVDFNMFLLNGEPELEGDIVSLLVSLRMCGKFGDGCVEIGGGGYEYDFVSELEYVSDPNYIEHVSYTGEKRSDSLYPATYEFNGDGCPSMISYDVIYDVFAVEYDKVADTSKPLPFNPFEGDKETSGDELWYRVTTKNYTETKTGEVKCPAVYTITYKD